MTEPRDLHCARCDARIELRHYDYPQHVRDHIPVVEAAAGPRDEITLDELVLRKWADLARRLIAVAPTSAVMDETGISAPHSTPPERQSIRAEADRIILRWLERDLALAKASK